MKTSQRVKINSLGMTNSYSDEVFTDDLIGRVGEIILTNIYVPSGRWQRLRLDTLPGDTGELIVEINESDLELIK